MSASQILVGEHDGVHVLRLMGDVRLTVCPSLDKYLDQAVKNPSFCNVVIDLSETQGIDSTSLGILAKLTIKMRQSLNRVPTLISINQNITKILKSMGFDKVFHIVTNVSAAAVSELTDELPKCNQLAIETCSDKEMQAKVLEAHKTLMSLNAANETEFRGLVEALEAQ